MAKRSHGEGSIYRESATGLWVAEISLPDGKRKRKRSKTQKFVKEWLLTQREALRRGLLVNDDITFTEFLDRFMKDVVTRTLKPKTIDSYKYIIDSHIKPELGNLKLSSLRPDHLQYLYSKKLDAGLSKRTVQYIHAVIRRSLNQAVKWGIIYRNPTDAVSAPRPQRKAADTLTEAQVSEFLKVVEQHRWYPIYVLAIATGMRQGEILGLRWDDIDFANGTISVRNTVYSIRGKIYLGEPKSEKSRRTISVPEFALNILKPLKKDGLVFTTSSGKPISPRNLSRHFHQSLEKAGFQHMRFHDLRHTCATLLLKMNIHPKVVQEMLGHSSITLTLDTYSHIIPSLQEEAAGKMNKIFKFEKQQV